MNGEQLKELGYESFKSDDIMYYAKDFPYIGYSLCTSDDNTFSISTFPEGDVLAKLDMVHLIAAHATLKAVDLHMKSFKNSIDAQIKSLFNLNTKGDCN